jgi:predicted dehydrogenase
MEPSMDQLRVGLSGCGAIGALHAKNLAARGVPLVFHNRTPGKARDFAERFGGESVADLGALLQASDAVVLATPPEHHTEAVLAALAADVPVLVEKPLCPTVQELGRIEAAATASRAFVMVAENYYYKPSLALMREAIAWDGIGAVRSLQVKKLTQQAAGSWKAAYGALLEGGVHFVALVADLVDAALAAGQDPPPLRYPDDVHAEFPTATPGDPAERQSCLRLTYGDQLEAKLHYAWDVPSWTKGTFQHSRIEGDAGRILFESNGIYVDVRGPGRTGLHLPNLRDLMGYGAMTDDFLRCLRQGARPYSDLARARRDLGIVFAAHAFLP